MRKGSADGWITTNSVNTLITFFTSSVNNAAPFRSLLPFDKQLTIAKAQVIFYDSVTSVSYTHLDVYKRQTLMSYDNKAGSTLLLNSIGKYFSFYNYCFLRSWVLLNCSGSQKCNNKVLYITVI